MGVRFIISNFWRFWCGMDTPWWIGLLSTNPLYFHNLKILQKTNAIFLAEERTRKNEHEFSFLEAMKVHITRISIFLQTKNAQTRTDSYCGKSNASKKRQCHFLQTQTMHNNFFNRIFPKKWGQALCACVGPPGPHPFLGKNSIKKIVVHRLRL